MGRNGGVTGLVRHLDGLQRLGNRADLVQLDEDRVAAAQANALGQALGVRDEQVVADQLDLAAQLLRHVLPALPVLLVEAVLDGVDGILLDQLLPVLDQLLTGKDLAALGQLILALFAALPLAGGSIHGQHKIPAGQVAGLLDGLEDILNGLLVAGKVGCKAALVTDGGGQTLGFQQRLQGVEHLGAPAQTLLEAGRTGGHDHELLHVHGVGRVRAAVQDVHHGHGQLVAGHAAQEAVQGHVQRDGRRAGRRDGNRQNGVCTEVGLILGAVGLQHSGVHGVDVGGIHAGENLVDGGVDVLNSFADALAAEAALVAVAQLQSLKFTGGRTAGGSTAANRAVGQPYLCLDGGVAAGVDDLAANDLLNFQIAHGTKSFLYKLLFQYARNGIKRYFKVSAS